MPKFCTKCGAETGSARFCVHCGNPLASASPLSAAPPPASKPGAALKIALIAILVIAVVGIAGIIGVVYYAKSRVHARLTELKRQTGVDIPAIVENAERPQRLRQKRDGCLLLPKGDAEGVLGFALARTDGTLESSAQDEHCDYYADPGALKQARENAAVRFRSLMRSKSAAPNDASQIENLVKSMGAGANDGSAPVLQITIYRGDANTALAGYRLGTSLMGGKNPSIPGPWDDAIFGPMNSTLVVRKGDNGVLIDLRQIPNGHDTGLAIARLIVPRL